LWELAALSTPFLEFNIEFFGELQERIVAGLRPTLPPKLPQNWSEAITSCWSVDPALRPSASDIIAKLK
jgi:hypothetical protein